MALEKNFDDINELESTDPISLDDMKKASQQLDALFSKLKEKNFTADEYKVVTDFISALHQKSVLSNEEKDNLQKANLILQEAYTLFETLGKLSEIAGSSPSIPKTEVNLTPFEFTHKEPIKISEESIRPEKDAGSNNNSPSMPHTEPEYTAPEFTHKEPINGEKVFEDISKRRDNILLGLDFQGELSGTISNTVISQSESLQKIVAIIASLFACQGSDIASLSFELKNGQTIITLLDNTGNTYNTKVIGPLQYEKL